MSTVNDYIEMLSGYDITAQATIDIVAMCEKEIGTEYITTDLRNKAVALLAMHWLSLGQTSSGTITQVGQIASEKEGDLSRTYKFNSKTKFSDDFLSQTSYGIALMSLNRANFFKPRNRAFTWLPL